jgi:PAS domain-containing protein
VTTERRQRPTPANLDALLRQLPAYVLLERSPIPTIAVSHAGVLYANDACATMLGYPDAVKLIGLPLPALLAAHADTPPRDCFEVMRDAAGTIIDWRHTEGYVVHTVLSRALLLRATDPALLVSLTDITDTLWDHQSPASTEAHRAFSD